MALDLSGTADPGFLTTHGVVASGTLRWIPPALVFQYQLSATPQTILLQGDKVVGVWTGVLTKTLVGEIRREWLQTHQPDPRAESCR